MLHYVNVCEREYYQNGVPKKDYNFVGIDADRETVSILAKTLIQLLGLGIKGLALGLNPVNKYRLPR